MFNFLISTIYSVFILVSVVFAETPNQNIQEKVALPLDAKADSNSYGAPLNRERIVPLNTVLKSPKEYSSAEFLTEGVVHKVCEKKGCWMEVKDGINNVRVTFKDYGFFVPQEILNRKVRLQGRLVEKTLSIKEQKHFLKDAKASSEEIAAVTEAKNTFEFIATGVQEK